jgi:ABC-type transport system involved in cytochrome c biogenesis permease subunit
MTFRSLWPAAVAAALASVYFLRAAAPPRDGEMHLRAAGMIPVVDGGRVKPLDTLARTSLLIISGRQTYKDEDGVEQPAIRWLLDVMSAGEPGEGPAAKHKIFRIENDQVLRLLDLENRPQFYRYSLNEIGKHFDQLDRETRRVVTLQKQGGKLDLFDQKLLELREHIELYLELAQLHKPLAVPPEADDEDWRSLADVEEDVRDRVSEKVRADLKRRGVDFKQLTEAQQAELMHRLRQEMDATRRRVSPAAAAWTDLLADYRAGDATGFNRVVADYGDRLGFVPPADVRRSRFETYFNQFQPFYHCLVLYVFAFVLAACSWVGFAGPLRRAAVGLAVATVLVHTAALFARMYLMDRPLVFVTNLYSTAIFIGWGCALLGLAVEWLYGMGLGTAIASVAGALSLVVAHFLALDTPTGDTLQMLQAVLDTNFWLATHVTLVNLGYAATFAAGLFGIVYVGLGLFTRALAGRLGKELSQTIYGIVCFGTLLSFVGTVAGGLWADYSWGRFWGWDPKENGALLIVIWNALILHARWGGVVKARGVAALAVLGNIIVVWSWFATNELGIGLHAYGASSGDKRMWIDIAWGVHLAVGLVGLLVPLKYWRSFRPGAKPPAGPRPAGRRGTAEVAAS